MSDVEQEQPAEEEAPAEPQEVDEQELEPDDEPDDEDDDGEAAAEAAPAVDEDRSKMFAKIDGSFNTYKRAVERNLEDELPDWLFCPLCASGSVPSYVNRHDLGRVPDEIQANVQMFLGFAREQEYEQDPNTRTCPTCNGKTKVTSGATAGDYIVRGCPECHGYGFVPPPGAGTGGNGHTHTAEESVSAALADLETPERDNWGEPRVLPDGQLNGNFGKMPQFKSVHPVYGVTANLSPEELVSG